MFLMWNLFFSERRNILYLTNLNELKLTQVELFSFFHFMCDAANAFKLLCMDHVANNERFLNHSNLSF